MVSFSQKQPMLKLLLTACFIFAGCSHIDIPQEYVYKEILTPNFTLASWQKITDSAAVYKIYIEGDGYAFNASKRATQDPTPRGTLVRKLAFGDTNPNVIYLARPCQYVKSPICTKRHWTTARFAPEIINAEYAAVKQIVGTSPVILIGFSGGAQIAGLIATAKPGLNVKKIITIAGNLDHLAWTEHHNLLPLRQSMNLESYRQQFSQILQIHYVGTDDKVIAPELVRDFVKNDKLVIEVNKAEHNTGWEKIYQQIWDEH